jgi:hypothetical protein
MESPDGIEIAVKQNFINGDTLEWTGSKPDNDLDGCLMMNLMRLWPESIEGKSLF